MAVKLIFNPKLNVIVGYFHVGIYRFRVRRTERIQRFSGRRKKYKKELDDLSVQSGHYSVCELFRTRCARKFHVLHSKHAVGIHEVSDGAV